MSVIIKQCSIHQITFEAVWNALTLFHVQKTHQSIAYLKLRIFSTCIPLHVHSMRFFKKMFAKLGHSYNKSTFALWADRIVSRFKQQSQSTFSDIKLTASIGHVTE